MGLGLGSYQIPNLFSFAGLANLEPVAQHRQEEIQFSSYGWPTALTTGLCITTYFGTACGGLGHSDDTLF